MMDEEGTLMNRRRHTPEQIGRKLGEAERMLGEGKAIPEVAKELEVSENMPVSRRSSNPGARPWL
jgi:hypothetical protein